MRIEQSGAVTRIWFEDVVSGSEYNFCLMSDNHHDSLWCNRDLEKRHLDEAVRRDAKIIQVGDLFDAMQGRFDPRRSYEDLRPEYKVPHYYDAIQDDAAKFYGQYAKNFLMIARGNHETGVVKNANIDLTSNLVRELRREGSQVVAGGYGGWIIFYFVPGNKGGAGRSSIRMRYYHGSGGEAPVTRGTIQTARQAVYLPDADVVVNGHSHNEYILSIKRERLTTHGRQYFDVAHYVRTPGYKDDYRDGSGGWEVERGGVPKPQGCVWMNIRLEKRSDSGFYEIRINLTADVV